jgi:predicted transposase YdaD
MASFLSIQPSGRAGAAVNPRILLARFNDRPISEICAMGGLTLDDFTSSRAYREIFREGEAAGEARGEASVTLRLLNRRCGPLSTATTTSIQALPLPRLELLAEALLDFTGGHQPRDPLALPTR